LLKFYDSTTFEEKVSLNIGEVGVTDIKWHRTMNQIFLGLDDGSALALFDPVLSQKGAVTCVTKRAVVIAPVEFTGDIVVKTPHALPLFRDIAYNKQKTFEKARKDALLSHEPLKPPPIKGTGGRQGTPATVTRHLL